MVSPLDMVSNVTFNYATLRIPAKDLRRSHAVSSHLIDAMTLNETC